MAQFWPMKRFVHHNPIHGLEHLPFDRAVREAQHLLGGNGYLSNREYRQLLPGWPDLGRERCTRAGQRRGRRNRAAPACAQATGRSTPPRCGGRTCCSASSRSNRCCCRGRSARAARWSAFRTIFRRSPGAASSNAGLRERRPSHRPPPGAISASCGALSCRRPCGCRSCRRPRLNRITSWRLPCPPGRTVADWLEQCWPRHPSSSRSTRR